MNRSRSKKQSGVYQTVYTNDFIYEYPQLVSPEECDRIVAHATKKGLCQDRFLDGLYLQSHEPVYNPLLTDQVWLDTSYPVIDTINQRISTVLHRSLDHQPPFEIIRYTSRIEATPPHHDAHTRSDLKREGIRQRFATMVLYLNDDYTGGETYFPLLHKTIRPEKGKMLFFYNVTHHDSIRHTSLHQNFKVTEGEKWVAYRCITL